MTKLLFDDIISEVIWDIKMANKSLLVAVSGLVEFRKRDKEIGDRIDKAAEEALQMIREEFRKEFKDFLHHMGTPSVEFLAYWESDEQCQKATKKALAMIIVEIETLLKVLREVADWNPTN